MKTRFAVTLPLGIAIGAALGVVYHNIPLGAGMGVVLGVLLGFFTAKRAQRSSD